MVALELAPLAQFGQVHHARGLGEGLSSAGTYRGPNILGQDSATPSMCRSWPGGSLGGGPVGGAESGDGVGDTGEMCRSLFVSGG